MSHAVRILLVDDEPTNLQVLRQNLKEEYSLLFARDGQSALNLARTEQPDLILLDIMMPDMTGYEVCQTLKSAADTTHIPVIFITALNDSDDEARALEIGGVDFISKPFVPAVLKARIRTQLSLVQAEQVNQSHRELLERLGRAAEYKDNETGMHVKRMSQIAYKLALAFGLDEHRADELLQVAPMHDIGKIGIADDILLKPGRLTEEEFVIMQNHPEIGAQILGDSDARLIRLARIVALTHHEKWDGSGYPNGLKGEDIPVEGRIVAIADVLDALTSTRPYKKAWTLEDALAFIREQSGQHFDPQLVRCLDKIIPDIEAIRRRWAD